MKIVFIGAVKFSESCLKKLISIDSKIVGVCTLEKSSFNTDHVDLKKICDENSIPAKYMNDIHTKNNIEWIKSLDPDVIFCFGWSKILKKDILNIPPLGVIGYHPAELPKNRGRHPIVWALVLGLSETASTFFFMDENADSGDIISQSKVLIQKNDNAKSLYDKITDAAMRQLEIFVPKLASCEINRTVQNHNNSNLWRKRNFNDGKIDWRMSSSSIYNLVRGLTKPYVGAHFEFLGNNISVWEVEIIMNNKLNIEPGKVIMVTKKGPIIKTGDQSVLLKHIEPKVELKKGMYI